MADNPVETRASLVRFSSALVTLEQDLSVQREEARTNARFDITAEIERVVKQIEDAKRCIKKVEESEYLTPSETEQGIALARLLLVTTPQPDPESYWGVVDTLLNHSRRII